MGGLQGKSFAADGDDVAATFALFDHVVCAIQQGIQIGDELLLAVRIPAGILAVKVPAINGMTAVVQNPVIADRTQDERAAGFFLQVQVITGASGVVVVHGTGAQIDGRSLSAVDAAAVVLGLILGNERVFAHHECCAGSPQVSSCAGIGGVALDGHAVQGNGLFGRSMVDAAANLGVIVGDGAAAHEQLGTAGNMHAAAIGCSFVVFNGVVEGSHDLIRVGKVDTTAGAL